MWSFSSSFIVSWVSFQGMPPTRAGRRGKGEAEGGEGKSVNGNGWSLSVLTTLFSVQF